MQDHVATPTEVSGTQKMKIKINHFYLLQPIECTRKHRIISIPEKKRFRTTYLHIQAHRLLSGCGCDRASGMCWTSSLVAGCRFSVSWRDVLAETRGFFKGSPENKPQFAGGATC